MKAALPAWVLKGAATLVTLLAATGASGYVASHQHSVDSPLHPVIVRDPNRLAVLPIIQPTDQKAIASTYAS